MPSIETMGHALVYKVDKNSMALSELPNTPERTAVRVYARALAGMQKEALVCYGPTGTVWRMVSDEGPYLNGTDLAPFPLAFFTTGMALSFVEELEKHAKTRGVELTSVSLLQDNYYSMQGSALRGDMIGGALPAKLVVELEADTSEAVVRPQQHTPLRHKRICGMCWKTRLRCRGMISPFQCNGSLLRPTTSSLILPPL
jgi:hypothetical protein